MRKMRTWNEYLVKVLADRIDALSIVLKALGFQLTIKPLACENPDLETDTVQTAHVAESPTVPHNVTK